MHRTYDREGGCVDARCLDSDIWYRRIFRPLAVVLSCNLPDFLCGMNSINSI